MSYLLLVRVLGVCVCHIDLMVPLRAGIGTLPKQVAGRSSGQFSRASLHELIFQIWMFVKLKARASFQLMVGSGLSLIHQASCYLASRHHPGSDVHGRAWDVKKVRHEADVCE